ncbi:hypothetical protein AAFF_G00171430 [Aldrovandia affinis]|uniref:Uncharacterized protein n=1 Tax=Aldrovandia affinis TaxID=143900 RepID=A0AAD7SYG4_9TELE|nr:hypothetical protein AAFF_G00171430 [Aldrovandia affinis]
MCCQGFIGIITSMLPYIICLLCSIQSATCFQVTVRDDNSLAMFLEPEDLAENATVYAVKVSGEPVPHVLQFQDLGGQAPPPLLFNASYHGLCYTVSLVTDTGTPWPKPVKTVTVLTQPLPVESVSIHDYQPSPETGVVFEIKTAEKTIFTRVNISYLEGREQRSMLYKDFFRGKTVFKHWLPGTCYSNITFRLVSEATANRTTLVRQSGVGHETTHHRTVPNPPLNVSLKIVHLTSVTPAGCPRRAPSPQGP